MSGWKTLERNLQVNEYAKRVCKENGFPYTGNLTLMSDCITSLAFMKGVDAWGGFFILMAAVELAKRQGVRVDRWFFQDAKYVEFCSTEMDPEVAWDPTPPAPANLVRRPN